MLVWVNRKKAKRLIKQVWIAHRNLIDPSVYNNGYAVIRDTRDFSEGMAHISSILGITDVCSPDEWEVE